MRTIKCRVFVIALVVGMLMAVPSVAMASLEDDPTFESSTNPGVGEGATWRWQWGNSWFPHLSVISVPTDGDVNNRNQTLGFIYEVRQVNTLGVGIVQPQWGTAEVSALPDQSTIEGVFDIGSVIDQWGWSGSPVTHPGSTVRGEGMYALGMRFYNQFRVEEATATTYVALGVDVTKPSAPQQLAATTSGSMAGGKWTEGRRRRVTWRPFNYDALSGVGGFKVRLNGKQVAFVHNSAPQPLAAPGTPEYEPYALLMNPGGVTPPLSQIATVTVEDLPAGQSSIEVITVDRATNESAASKVSAYVDFDTPTIKIDAPSSGGTVGAKPTLRVTAGDAAGVSKVEYFVDGVPVGTSTTKPFSKTVDLSDFSNGTHTLTAKAFDMIGDSTGTWTRPHTATATRSFKLDKTAPKLSNISGSPNPFYPRKREGYKDNHTVRYTANKSGTLKVVIKNSSGKTVRTLSKNVGKGSGSVVWNGKYSDGSVHSGTFKYYVTLTDAGGQTFKSSTRSVSIRFTQVVRVDNSTVKIIQR